LNEEKIGDTAFLHHRSERLAGIQVLTHIRMVPPFFSHLFLENVNGWYTEDDNFKSTNPRNRAENLQTPYPSLRKHHLIEDGCNFIPRAMIKFIYLT